MNIDAVKRQIEESIPWRDGVLTVEQAFALVAEVERLRGERAAVVAFLREWQNTMDDRITHDDLDYAIAVIERGEHRHEEKK
jgi:hypothetical protein